MTDTSLSLSATDIAFSFGTRKILNEVSLEVKRGKFVALLGPNGAGKTTLFSIITGLYGAHRGSIRIGDHDLKADTQSALACIGVVFQRPTLDRDLTIKQNLIYFCNLHGISRQDAQPLISKALDCYGLSELANRKVTQLSGGQQRRIELARALLHEPKLLLLDEPTVGLDHQNRMEFVSNVKKLCTSQQAGVLWATHLMDEVEDADHVYILDKGKIVFDGGYDDIVRSGDDSVAQLFNQLTIEQNRNG